MALVQKAKFSPMKKRSLVKFQSIRQKGIEPIDPLTHGADHDISDIHTRGMSRGKNSHKAMLNEANVGATNTRVYLHL